jgi:hypothetical protein
MASARVFDNVDPTEIAEAATTRDLRGFLTLYGDTLLLLVRLRDGDSELASGLGATAVRGNAGTPVKPAMGSMDFHTVIQTSPTTDLPRRLPGAQKQETEAVEVAKRLEETAHFAVPLRKRSDADALYMDRISVGRARNKDIVLRHQSVSKFHCWFEIDETGAFYLADAGSKNSTRLNAQILTPRERTRIEPGDSIRFGSVDAILCSPRALWTALAGGAKRTG